MRRWWSSVIKGYEVWPERGALLQNVANANRFRLDFPEI